MKILKFICVCCLSLCIFQGFAEAANMSNGSNIQISDLQTQKKTTILNKLYKEDLISTEIKKLGNKEQEEVVCLALNMYHENRNSSIEDQIASTYVVFNRLDNNDYPLTYKNKNICNIVFDRYQFCWTNNDVVPVPREKDAWKHAQELAYKLYTQPIHRKLAKRFKLQHYVVTPLIYDSSRPKWINKRKLTMKIGKHSYMSISEGIADTKENANKLYNILAHAKTLVMGKLKNLEVKKVQ